jgi:CheY-like chemotaxis protein
MTQSVQTRRLEGPLQEVIVLVEDDEDLRETLAELLRLSGYAVLTAANGRDAIAVLRQAPEPCLVLLDLMMPVMDGWQFRRAQLGDPQIAGVPVVVISGADDVAAEAEALEAVAHLTKPIELRDVLGVIDRHC